MVRIFKDYAYTIITLLVAFATLQAFFKNYFPKVSQDSRFAIGFIIVLFVWVFFENLYIKTKWGRNRKYAETLWNITNGFSGIHKLTEENDRRIDSSVRACEILCSEIATAYTIITGTKCNVAIKMLEKDVDDQGNDKLKAISFARSFDLSRNPKDNEVKHWIDKNTDFSNILEKVDKASKECYFFSNSLPLRFGYLNTSYSVYGTHDPDQNLFLRYWRWPLPYKSAIVVPICTGYKPKTNTLVGFLCVDSTNIGAFKKNFDVALLTGITDGIFNLISRISKLELNREGIV